MSQLPRFRLVLASEFVFPIDLIFSSYECQIIPQKTKAVTQVMYCTINYRKQTLRISHAVSYTGATTIIFIILCHQNISVNCPNEIIGLDLQHRHPLNVEQTSTKHSKQSCISLQQTYSVELCNVQVCVDVEVHVECGLWMYQGRHLV